VGAFARAQAEGTKLFEGLVKEGLNLEQTARKIAGNRADVVRDAVENRVGQARERAVDTWIASRRCSRSRAARAGEARRAEPRRPRRPRAARGFASTPNCAASVVRPRAAPPRPPPRPPRPRASAPRKKATKKQPVV
jgi:hypothetical protein